MNLVIFSFPSVSLTAIDVIGCTFINSLLIVRGIYEKTTKLFDGGKIWSLEVFGNVIYHRIIRFYGSFG